MTSVLLSLCCSLSWGVSDFLGGWLGRRIPVRTVLLWSQGTGLCAGLAFALAFGGRLPGATTLVVSLGAGVCSVAGVASLYRALALGPMGVVAPIAATSALLPVIVGVTLGDRPSVTQAAGMAAVLAGVAVTTRSNRGTTEAATRRGVLLAIAAAAAFGSVQLLLGAGAGHSLPWTIGVMRIGAVVAIVCTARWWPQRRDSVGRSSRLPVGLLVLIGLLDITAATFYAGATTQGLVSVVAVLGSLYPVVTVLLAGLVLRERLASHQVLGATATLAGVVLVASF